ncbi:unnamed protein product [Brachionus calyciflorus]|uniref:Uncharacterized protein n=1 Tax=Brachionus calyciflorus TaxID=104777 RepID=A0A814NBC5_9BILA|nr:unnamed protein product [Brachionus calyciflorus]
MKLGIYFILFSLSLIGVIKASHFYGGSINWKAVETFPNGSVSVQLEYKFYWRSDFDIVGNYRCNDTKIATQFPIGDASTVNCNVGCTPNSFSLNSKVYCDGYSLTNNWSSGKRTELVTLSSSQKYVEALFTGSSWLTLRSGGGSWQIRVKMNLTTRSDINKINTPPISLSSPIIKLKLNCNSTIKIPVFDQDGDRVKCRFSTGNECGGICQTVPGAIIDSDKCTLTFKPASIGYFAAALQIEDFSDQISSTLPLSSVPIQFLFYVENKPCNVSDIYFNELTLEEDSCIGLDFNQTYNGKIVIYSVRPVTEIITLGPVGLTKSPIQNYNGNSSLWYIDISWLPNSPSQIGTNIFCFQGVNDQGSTTEQRCVNLVVGGKAPLFSNPYPTGQVDTGSSYTLFTIDSPNEPIKKSTDLSYINIYNNNTNNLILRIDSNSLNLTIENSTKLQFNVMNNLFVENETYYILFDTGVAKGTKYCGIKSTAITDSAFWTFSIKKVSTTTMVSETANTDEATTTTTVISQAANTDETTTKTTSVQSTTITEATAATDMTNLITSYLTTNMFTLRVSDKILTTSSLTCTNTDNYWFIILWIVIAVLLFLLICLTCALCYLLGYIRRMKKILPTSKKPILVKQKEEMLVEKEEQDLNQFKFYIKRSQEYGYKCVTLQK